MNPTVYAIQRKSDHRWFALAGMLKPGGDKVHISLWLPADQVAGAWYWPTVTEAYAAVVGTADLFSVEAVPVRTCMACGDVLEADRGSSELCSSDHCQSRIKIAS